MKKAVTLAELVITMAMLAVVITAISMIMIDSMVGFSNTTVLASLQNESVTINQIYQNELRNATDVSILEKAPVLGEFDPNKEYIYTDDENKTIMIKMAGEDTPTVLYEQEDVNQYMGFSKVDEKTVESVLTLNKKNIPYNLKTNTTLVNLPPTDELKGSVGDCIMFNFSRNGVFLRQLNFKKADNSDLGTDAASVIDEENLLATCEVQTDNLKLRPRVSTINASYITWGSPTAEPFDVDNPTVIDFSTEQKLFIFGPDGSYKMYKIDVTESETDVLPDVVAGSMDIVPTYKGGDPSDKTHRSMPTDNDELNAVFKLKDDTDGNTPYLVTWYAVDDFDDIKTMSKWSKVAEIKNSKKLDLSDPAYRDQLVGRYVFCSAQSINSSGNVGTPLYSVTPDMFADITKTTPCVYVQVGYGKMWGTTINEIDYRQQGNLTSKQFQNKRNAIDNAYAKSDTFRNGGTIKIGGKNYTIVGYKTKKDGSLISSDSFKDARKVLLPGDGVDGNGLIQLDANSSQRSAKEVKYYTNLKDMSVNIKGNRFTNNATNELGTTHSIIVGIDQYHIYYTDRRQGTFPAGIYENSGIRYAIKTEPNSLGGFAISSNVKPVETWDSNDKRLGSTFCYYFDFINNKKWDTNKDYSTKGIKMVDVDYNKLSGYYTNNNQDTLIGARNFTPGRAPSEIPYFFSDISTSNFEFDFNKTNDVTIDTKLYMDNSNSVINIYNKSSPRIEMDIYKTKKENSLNVPDETKKSVPMYFGGLDYKSMDSVYSYKSLSGVLNTLYTVPYEWSTENGVGLATNMFGPNQRPFSVVTAWGKDGLTGDFEFTLKNIEGIDGIK